MSRTCSLPDEERYPLLDDEGRRLLGRLLEHPSAPRYNFRCGDQLTAAGLERVRAYERELNAAPATWAHGAPPAWVGDYAAWCLREVPFYRKRKGAADDFFALPTCDRADLSREPWSFVPDSQPLDDMIVYDSTGTTGAPLYVPAHPEVSAKYLPALRAALARQGVRLEGGPGSVAIMTICAQDYTLTYATVSAFLDQAAYVKINLNPGEWRDPQDCVRFIDDCRPEIFSGDPLAFAALAQLPVQARPKALVSSAMTLLPGMQRRLEARFGCPVIDVYSLCESRFIAARRNDAFEIIPHDIFVEILDRDGRLCAPGERGEIVLTGGRNPFQAMLRYRTDDYAAMAWRDGRPVLTDFEGRQPTLFVDTRGELVNNINVTHALRPFALAQFSLHQFADRRLRLRLRGDDVDEASVRQALVRLFGDGQELTIEALPGTGARGGKVIQYTSDLTGDELAEKGFSFRRTAVTKSPLSAL
ncbi:MAG TPA: capsule biosynthesis protein CapK [Blastocatellia bacterium]|nr:capsule biosynthesis protein CapK [Blastocatellia bacterium]